MKVLKEIEEDKNSQLYICDKSAIERFGEVWPTKLEMEDKKKEEEWRKVSAVENKSLLLSWSYSKDDKSPSHYNVLCFIVLLCKF